LTKKEEVVEEECSSSICNIKKQTGNQIEELNYEERIKVLLGKVDCLENQENQLIDILNLQVNAIYKNELPGIFAKNSPEEDQALRDAKSL